METERREFGQLLRRLRKKAGITGSELAARAKISQSKISKIENGQVGVTVADTQTIIDVLGIDVADAQSLRNIADRLAKPYRGWTRGHRDWLLEAQMEYGSEEEIASTHRQYQDTVVPGLLQTKEYAREVIERFVAGESVNIAAVVRGRLWRQRILSHPDKAFTFLVTENVLRRAICNSEDMIKQLQQVERQSSADNVRIGVIPSSADTEKIAVTNFVILDRHVSVETQCGGLRITQEEEVQEYEEVFAALERTAEYGDQLTKLLKRIQQSFKRKSP